MIRFEPKMPESRSKAQKTRKPNQKIFFRVQSITLADPFQP